MELTAMFIYGGYRDVLGTKGMDSSLINETYCGGGEVEAARALNCVADDVDNAVTPLLAEQDGPGVWYYDVAEPLGAWIAETAAAGVRVDESDIVAKAVELTNEWLREVNQ